jgi:hypothetical protein
MSKMMIVMALIITGVFIHLGLALNSKTILMCKEKEGMMFRNISMFNEIKQKQVLRKIKPKRISNAYMLFINQSKMFEIYSGTQMKLVFSNAKENENIEDHYVETEFRNVKGLPLTIHVGKFSNNTDLAGILKDIYLLENRTDFKVSEISTGNNILIVKGELYGI